MKRFYILPLLLLCLMGCQKEDNYQVDPELDSYLQLFLQEASKRGYNFNVEKDGLILRFDPLQAPKVGLCTYTDPLLIQIDPTYWKTVEQYANCEDLRRDVVFHELGHGLLNRHHENAYLNNNEWKSIMCGGEKVEDRNWQINFNGYRREYYLDELFNIRTEEPWWAQSGTFNDSKGDTIAVLNQSTDFYRKDSKGNIYENKNGVYSITCVEELNTILPVFTGNIEGDFYYELLLSSELNGEDVCIGIGTRYTATDGENYYNLFNLEPNRKYDDYRVYPINQRYMAPLAEVIVSKKTCQFSEPTLIGLEKKNGEFFLFFNNQLIYRHELDAEKSVNRLSVVIPQGNTTRIYSAACYKIGNAPQLRSAKTHIEQVFEGELEPLPTSLNFNRIK